MASSVPIQIAETIQTAHLKRNPSAAHDISPSTAASRKEPVTLEKSAHFYPDDGIDEDEDEEDVPYSVLRPKARQHHLPPMPDLRYEQSYLHSIRSADTWWWVVLITARDQVMMPFIQGVAYNLAISGWQYWNKGAQLHGSTIGAKVRRWWYGVNNWKVPPQASKLRR
ncbi:hypothetical protein B0T16DRAFT_412237 [Cercophora newfieldiana]|uniref:DUF1770-domain-containing protein n=1 Tax=Cercophora newfieldiana TaxID=92897 RepID=A0AA39Y4K4_9PEZI|nr:hypothetical protein B0T16DRAFT_412237 [Cercophora newfieldiana]